MDENKFREESLKLERDKFNHDVKKSLLENTFFKKNFGVIVTTIATFILGSLGYMVNHINNSTNASLVHQANINLQAEVAGMKIDSYTTYVSVVNECWSVWVTNGTVDGNLKKKGIDAFEVLRLVSSVNVYNKAHTVNSYFKNIIANKQGDYKEKKEEEEFNNAIADLVSAMRKEFVIVQKSTQVD